MLKKGILSLIFIILISCSTNKFEFENVDELMEKIKKENNLNSYPELLVDGFVLNYKVLKGKINLSENNIGHFEYVENKDNGVLRVLTKLPEINKNEFKEYYVELDSEKVEFEDLKRIELKNIKKKISLSAEKLNDKKYDGYKKVILLFSK